MAIPDARQGPGVHPWPMTTIPDPEVPERPTRRRFSAAYTVAIPAAHEAAGGRGAQGARRPPGAGAAARRAPAGVRAPGPGGWPGA